MIYEINTFFNFRTGYTQTYWLLIKESSTVKYPVLFFSHFPFFYHIWYIFRSNTHLHLRHMFVQYTFKCVILMASNVSPIVQGAFAKSSLR